MCNEGLPATSQLDFPTRKYPGESWGENKLVVWKAA